MLNPKRISITEIVAATIIVIVLVFVVYPRFVDILKKSDEVSARANLMVIRNAIADYYGNNSGNFPSQNVEEELTKDGKYLKAIPELKGVAKHASSSQITTTPTGDSGMWAYQVEDSQDRQAGEIWIDCSCQDSNGVVWSTY